MNVVVAGGFLVHYEAELRKALEPRHTVSFPTMDKGRQAFLDTLERAHVLVATTIDEEALSRCKSLRLIQVPGAGVDGIPFSALPEGVKVANTYGHGPGIAEHVLLLMLALSRNLVQVDQKLRTGRWLSTLQDPRNVPPSLELRGKTVGILGWGTIGREVGRYARALGMEVAVFRRSQRPEGQDAAGAEFVPSLHDLLRVADFLVVAVPLTPETRGIVGREELALMKPGAFIINVARGAVIDEGALYDALRNGRIAGAGLDVWYRYPAAPGSNQMPADLPFWELPNVIMTPHIAGVTRETFSHRIRDIVENIRRLENGEPLLNEIQTG